MEPRGAIGVFDAFENRYTLYSGLQTPHRNRWDIATNILHIPETKLRVVANDVGGSFGMKGGTYREQLLVLWAARRTGATAGVATRFSRKTCFGTAVLRST